MTHEQERNIEAAWAKLRSTKERLKRAADALKSAGLARAPEERLQELDQLYQDAVDADSMASDELENAMRAIGLNV
ncbi:hypothetical protein [Paraburkholderia ferrariae]|uniref:hypothetical protein n=1 Tax=Paraburkholderia ferrariae TaxID=386056 RepID=UPI0004859885|nr:hypothetical protein [Paraburkholderia ferrariae]